MKKSGKIFLCLLAVVVLAAGAFLGWNHVYNTPDVTDQSWNGLMTAGYGGTAPEEFAGLYSIDGENVLYVTKDSLHSLKYWQRMCAAEPVQPTRLRRVRYSVNEASQSWLDIKNCLEQEWTETKSYRVTALLMLDEKLGYRVFLTAEGRDAGAVQKELASRFGDLVQPWNEQADAEYIMWSMTEPSPAYEPLLPLKMKSKAYSQNETLYNQGKGEKP